MKITLIGHGAMGRLIETLATEKGHEISQVIHESDAELFADAIAEKLKGSDVTIDF